MCRKVVKVRKKKGCDYMNSNVIDTRTYIRKNNIKNISMLDMIFNPVKRVDFYKEVDSNYVATQEEEDIFDEINRRRKSDF